MVTTAQPSIAEDLGADLGGLQWVTSACTLAFALGVLLVIVVSSHLGERRTLLAGVALFGLSSIAWAMSDSMSMLIASRTVQGLAASALTVVPLALLSKETSFRSRPLTLGVWSAIAATGAAIGPLVGGAVVEGWQWQFVFWLNLPIALLAVLLVIFAFTRDPERPSIRDLRNCVLLLAGTLVTFWVIAGDEPPTVEIGMLGLIAAACTLLAVWGWRHALRSLFSRPLFVTPGMVAVNTVGFVYNAAVFGAVFLLMVQIQTVQGASALTAGIMTLPWSLSPMLLAPLAGRATSRYGPRPVIRAGLLLQAAGLASILVVLSPTSSAP